jgi:HD-GYP domain-containing protein (c-di-GMP phosphodiesterase class II)
VFDALAASDRPYKRAVPAERALDILRSEVQAGRIDEVLLDLFIDARVYDAPGARPRAD